MAKRRINTRFVAIASSVVVGGLAVALVVPQIMSHGDPKAFVRRGDEEWKAGHLVEAERAYRSAVQRSKTPDLAVRNKYGELLQELGRTDPNYADQGRLQWEAVLQVDPGNLDALRHLLAREIEIIEQSPVALPTTLQRLATYSDKILQSNPADLQAKAYREIAVIASWLGGIITPDEQLKRAMDKLEDLRHDDPANPDIPYYLSMALVKQAKELRTAGQAPEAKKLEVRAYTVFNDAVLAQPNNAVMKLRFYQTLLALSASLDKVEEDEYVKDRQDYVDRMGDILAKAKAGVDDEEKKAKEDPAKYQPNAAFTEVYTNYATYLRRQKKLPEAEALLRELLAKRPNDQIARLALANLLHDLPDPIGAKKEKSNLDEAINLLKNDISDQGTRGVITSRNKQSLEIQTYAELTNYLIEKFTRTTEPADRKKVQDEVNDYYQRLTEKNGVTPLTLKLKGKISLMRGDVAGAVEAIPQLERARDMLSQRSADRKIRDWELEYLLASAYNDSHQTGLAKQQLAELRDNVPTFIPAQKMYFRLALDEHDTQLASQILSDIKRMKPDDVDIARMSAALARQGDSKYSLEEVAKLLETLPENTPAEIRQKIPPALYIGRIDKAIDLYEKLRALPAPEGPGNIDTSRSLVQLYMAQGPQGQPKAKGVIDDALKVDPENIAFKVLSAQYDAAMADKNDPKKVADAMARIEALTLEGIQSIKDPVERELNFYNHYVGKSRAANASHDADGAKVAAAEAMKHLDEAEKLKPEDGKILDIRFNRAVEERKWDVAGKLAERLGVLNVDEAHGAIYRYRLAILQGNMKRAEEVARQLVQDNPQFARSWLCYGEVLRVQRQYEEAIGKYSLALEKQNGSVEAFDGIIQCYLALNKPDEAKRYIDAGLKSNPGHPGLTERQIAWELEYGDPTKAIQPRELAVKQNPNDIGPRVGLGAAWWQVAQTQIQKNRGDDAKKSAEKAKAVFNEVVAKWTDADLAKMPEQAAGAIKLSYAYLADIATYQQDIAGGETALKALAGREKWKDSADPYMLLAQFYARFGKAEQAEAAFATALEKSKNSPDVQRQVAAYYYVERKFDKALSVLDPNTKDRRLQQQMLEIMLASNKLTEAGKLLQRMEEANPNDAQVMASKGFLLLQQRQLPEALAALDKSVSLDPRNATALYYRGVLKMRQGPAGVEAAIKDLTAARDNTDPSNIPQQVQTRLGLGEALLVHNPPLVDDAVLELTRCVELQPDNKDVRMKLIERLGSLVQPQWNQVERLLNEAKAMPQYKEDPDWRRVESSMWLTRNNPDKALASIKEALVLAGKLNNPQRTLPLMQDYLTVLLRLKKFQELKNECDAVLAVPGVDATAWWVYQNRAMALANGVNGANRADALNDFDKALEIAGKLRNDDAVAVIIQSIADTIGVKEAIQRVEARANAGDNHWRVIGVYLYLSRQDFANAEAMLAKVMEPAALDKLNENEKKSAYGVAGSVYMMSAKYDKAQEVYEQLLKMSPEDTVALNNLACLWTDYREKPDPTKALTYSTKALEIMQKVNVPDPNVLDTHGWALINANQLDSGMDFVQTAIDRRPQMMEAHYHLGVGLFKKQLYPESVRELEKARKMLDDRKNKGQSVDLAMEARLNQALTNAKAQLTGPTAGTSDAAKP